MIKIFIIVIIFVFLFLFILESVFILIIIINFTLEILGFGLAKCSLVQQEYNDIANLIQLVYNTARSKFFTHFSYAFKGFFNDFFISFILKDFVVMREYHLVNEFLNLFWQWCLNWKSLPPLKLIKAVIEMF